MSNSTDQRIIELETQLAHTQYLFDQLNQVVIQQANRIDRMAAVIEKLSGQVEQLKSAGEEKRDLLDEKPPHY